MTADDTQDPDLLTPPQEPPAEKPAAKASSKAKSSGFKVGDTWTLPKGTTIVVLPDGTAVTARAEYPLNQEGTYKAITAEGYKDASIKVSKAKA